MMKDHEIKSSYAQRKKTILIADDSEINRAILADMLDNEYTILEAGDGIEAIEKLQAHADIDLVLLDIMMPKMDGFEVLLVMEKYHWMEEVPVIMISSENSSAIVNRAYKLGVTDYISRPFDESIVCRRVSNTLMLYSKQKRLAQMVTDQIYENEKQASLMINILSHIVEFRNSESGPHVIHICLLTKMLLNHLVQKYPNYQLNYSEITLVSLASALHDIGKIMIPDEILNKPGRLTPKEFEIMKTHAISGANMLQSLPFYTDEPIVKICYEICRWHHERYDGKGYPDGLVGEQIPITAQIVSIADVYDALTSERVYKSAIPHKEAIKMILNGECGIFNPMLLECLSDLEHDIEINLSDDYKHLTHSADYKKIFKENQVSVSERTLTLLEHERTKYQFFALMSREIQFEYDEVTKRVTISDWGVKQLGLKETTLNLNEDSKLKTAIGINNLLLLRSKLGNTTPEFPDCEQNFELLINGEIRWYRFICRSLWQMDEEPQFIGAIGKVIDISNEYNELLKLQHLASHDSLTELLTHNYAKEKIIKTIAENPNKKFAMILLDLDNFKGVNDTKGHLYGDKVLCHTANCLKKYLNKASVIARVGGDEFLMFVEYEDLLLDFANEVFVSLCDECQIFQISVSMGIALSNEDNKDYDAFFKQADQALYTAKEYGRKTYCVYDETMSNRFSAISSIDNNIDVN